VDWHELILGREQVPELAQDTVHVWRVSTGPEQHDLTPLTEILSSEETARAARFHFDKDRRAYVVCRGTLRRLLTNYSASDPAEIQFCYGAQGKPALEHPSIQGLHFNVSHSGEIALLAFARGREVGVDVEFKRNVDYVSLAERSFSNSEYETVLSCPPAKRADIFYEYWSCKEACIKADGRGLSAPLGQFGVVAHPDDPAWRQVVSAGSEAVSPELRIRVLTVADGYAGAVAATGRGWNVEQFSLPGRKDL
jgi:4'-phosphopantetheinyl transferase